MEGELIIPILFFFIAALGGICLLIFCFRKNDDGYDYDKIIRMMHEQTEENLDALSKMNKEKDKIEEKIRDKKKKSKYSYSILNSHIIFVPIIYQKNGIQIKVTIFRFWIFY